MSDRSPLAGPSPLTDPRSVSSSVVFHGLLLLLASVAVIGVGLPGETEPLPIVMQAQLGPVDNRAPAEEGGGSPGELGGDSPIASATISAEGGDDATPTRDPAAALLSDVLPSKVSDSLPRDLPGPSTSGLGVLPGPGTGGGGGSGGGSGGGKGKGIGPGTQFFGAREHADSFAYVIDCSGSMANRDALGVAKRELWASLSQLPPDAKFGVIFYNLDPTVFADAKGREGLMSATAENKARVRGRLARIGPEGGTDHMKALRAAIDLRPEVIFFLTDADVLTRADVERIRAEAGNTRVQAVEFGIGPDPGTNVPLRTLATSSGGTYRYIDVLTFRAPR